MRRITPRDIALYLILFAVVFYSVSYLQRADWEDGPDYSQIRTYFTQERVEYFTLKDNVLTLTLRDVEEIDAHPAALGHRLVCDKAGKRWLHHPRAETYLSERVALFQRLYR